MARHGPFCGVEKLAVCGLTLVPALSCGDMAVVAQFGFFLRAPSCPLWFNLSKLLKLHHYRLGGDFDSSRLSIREEISSLSSRDGNSTAPSSRTKRGQDMPPARGDVSERLGHPPSSLFILSGFFCPRKPALSK